MPRPFVPVRGSGSGSSRDERPTPTGARGHGVTTYTGERCSRPGLVRSWCHPHYRRVGLYGDLVGRPTSQCRISGHPQGLTAVGFTLEAS